MNNESSYFIADLFSIKSQNGQIFVSQSLQGHIGTFNLTVAARNAANYTNTSLVSITVLQSLNTPPNWIQPSFEFQAYPVLEV